MTLAVTMVAAAVPAWPAPAGAAATTISDAIVGFTYVLGAASLNVPGEQLRIHVGDTVVWTNLDPVSHDVSFDALPVSQYLPKPGSSARVTFDVAGYFTYRCNEHPEFPGMKGLVFVTD